MKTSSLSWLVPIILLLGASIANTGPTGKKTDDKHGAKSKKESFERKLIDRSIRDLKVYAGDERTQPLKPDVVMRWPNNIRGTKDGATMIWTDKGLPKVACCIYTWQGRELHFLFGSLAAGPVTADLDGTPMWHPTGRAVEFRSIPKASEPAASHRVRLFQIKVLSRRFSCQQGDGKKVTEVLRLVPRPIYRYDFDGKQGENVDVLDGAMFAFAQGTDPEALLMIEARRTADGYQWEYATAKRTVGQIDVKLDGKLVRTHRWGGWNKFDPDATFTTLKLPIKRDRNKLESAD